MDQKLQSKRSTGETGRESVSAGSIKEFQDGEGREQRLQMNITGVVGESVQIVCASSFPMAT